MAKKKASKARPLLVLLLIGLVWFGVEKYQSTALMIYPMPYILPTEGDVDGEDAQILVLGDQFGKALGQSFEEVVQRLSIGLKAPLKVVNWSVEGQGLHRILGKLAAAKKLPPLVFYQAGASEWREKKFNLEDDATIRRNFTLSDNPTLLSLVMAFPPLSHFVYLAPQYVRLKKEISTDAFEYPAREQQRRLALGHEIYRRELGQLVEILREQGSSLVLITAPVNLELPPGRTCENADTTAVQALNAQMKGLIDEGKSKEALATLERLSQTVPGNAEVFHLMGRAHTALGDHLAARQAFEKANAFDCEVGRASVVSNAILRAAASRHSLLLIDFAEDLARQLGQDQLFLNDTMPQTFPYQKLAAKIRQVVARQFHLLGPQGN